MTEPPPVRVLGVRHHGPGSARAVVRADAARVLEIPVDDAGVRIDVDTPDDFRRLTSRT